LFIIFNFFRVNKQHKYIGFYHSAKYFFKIYLLLPFTEIPVSRGFEVNRPLSKNEKINYTFTKTLLQQAFQHIRKYKAFY